QAVLPRDLAAVALVADDRILAPKLVAAFLVRPLEEPVVGAVDRELGLFVHELPVTLAVAASEEADPRELVLRPRHQVMTPEAAQERMLRGIVIVRIALEGLFPADEGPAFLLGAHLPAACVAAEERDVAAVGHELFQMVAHQSRPVFVVADAEDELVMAEHFGMEFEVAVDGVV